MHSFKEVNIWLYDYIYGGHIIINADYAHFNTGNSDSSDAVRIVSKSQGMQCYLCK